MFWNLSRVKADLCYTEECDTAILWAHENIYVWGGDPTIIIIILNLCITTGGQKTICLQVDRVQRVTRPSDKNRESLLTTVSRATRRRIILIPSFWPPRIQTRHTHIHIYLLLFLYIQYVFFYYNTTLCPRLSVSLLSLAPSQSFPDTATPLVLWSRLLANRSDRLCLYII